MTPEQWNDIKHFDPSVDNFGNPDKMEPKFIYTLDAWRDYIALPVIVHCGYELRDKGYHPKGLAADVHVERMALFDAFLSAMRFGFTGIGVCPFWNRPGLHLDTRPRKKNQPRALWGYNGLGEEVLLTKQFLFQTL